MSEDLSSALDRVISYSLANKSNSHDLKKGISKHTEHYAYEYILPRLNEDFSHLDTLALRLSALIAESETPYNKDLSFGKWVKRFAPKESEGVKTRLKLLMNLDLEQAVLAISRILKMVDSKGVGFNWYDLARNLIFWGDGMSEKSLTSRQRILRDYYISFNEELDESDKKPAKESEVE